MEVIYIMAVFISFIIVFFLLFLLRKIEKLEEHIHAMNNDNDVMKTKEIIGLIRVLLILVIAIFILVFYFVFIGGEYKGQMLV